MPRSVRVTVEPSKSGVKRVWLKAVDSSGGARTHSIPREDAVRARNELVERLSATGEYDEVIGEAIGAFPEAEPRKPWVRREGDPDGRV